MASFRKNHFKRLQHKHYAARKVKNPYFRSPRVIPWKWIAGTTGGVVIFSGVFYFFYLSFLFQIESTEILGTQDLSAQSISETTETYLKERSLIFSRKSNYFRFNEDELRGRLEELFAFKNLEIQRRGRVLRLTVEERSSNLLWKSSDDAFVVDRQGIVVRLSSSTESRSDVILPVFVDLNERPVKIGSQVLSSEEIEHIFRFHEHLRAQEIAFTETRLDRLAGRWMSVQTLTGYAVLFDPSGDMDKQAENLSVVLRERVRDPSKLQYIDLRFGDRVYFK